MSEAAEQAGVNVQTVRYYERRRLLPPPRRDTSGYRGLQPDTVRPVRVIKRAQDLGFSLEEIAELLSLWSDKVRHRSRVRDVAERRLQQVERKIAELLAIRDVDLPEFFGPVVTGEQCRPDRLVVLRSW